MKVTLVGMGLGAHDTLTLQALHLLQEADFIVGAKRLLETLPDGCTQHRFAATKPEAILQSLLQSAAQHPCVAYSGDTGFYSGTRSLLPLLKARGITAEVFSGISSVQYFAARLARSWQDWNLVSAHGTACDAPAALRCQKPVFFLTGGVLTPATLCEQLVQTGLGALRVTVGEQLSYDTECIREGTAAEFAQQTFAPLSVLLAEAALPFARRTPGISDTLFVRGDVPMTKQEVRAVALAKLQVTPEDICWDIGAGTGSVSVELALQANAVYAVERSAKAYHLAEQNKTKFGVWNLHLKKGTAPAALAELPAPDAVFVGGSGGSLVEILGFVQQANPKARVCVAAIALETLHTALCTMTALGYETELVQIGISRAKPAGDLHLLLAQNPVFLITGIHA